MLLRIAIFQSAFVTVANLACVRVTRIASSPNSLRICATRAGTRRTNVQSTNHLQLVIWPVCSSSSMVCTLALAAVHVLIDRAAGPVLASTASSRSVRLN